MIGGSLVLLVEKTPLRGKFTKGVIKEAVPLKDGIVKEVSVRRANGVFRWHLRQLCLLEGQMEQTSSPLILERVLFSFKSSFKYFLKI